MNILLINNCESITSASTRTVKQQLPGMSCYVVPSGLKTEMNVKESDGTLIITCITLTGGFAPTRKYAHKHLTAATVNSALGDTIATRSNTICQQFIVLAHIASFFMQVIVMNLFISMSNETKKWQNIGLTLPGSKTVADSIALN